jgi:hypothetical protein
VPAVVAGQQQRLRATAHAALQALGNYRHLQSRIIGKDRLAAETPIHADSPPSSKQGEIITDV